jgi:hypothetical protein
VDVVGEGALAVDLDYRQPFTVGRLELRVAADVDLDQLEWMLGPNALEHGAGTVAEVATGGREQRDADGYG